MKIIYAALSLSLTVTACNKQTEGGATKETVAPKPEPVPDKPAPVGGSAAAPGSATPPVAPGPKLTFGTVPEGWSPDEDPANRMTLVVAVNETKFPVDNALFSVDYGFEPDTAPKDPTAYAAWLDKEQNFKVAKTEAVPRGHYFESKDRFHYSLEHGNVRVFCGGSLYKDADYNKIPKIRDASVKAAKQLCASVKPG